MDRPRPAARGIFVTGTDTGVGKTVIAAALVRTLCAQGLRAVGMKPVAAGVEPNAAVNADVAALAAADGAAVAWRDRNPYAFAPPIAPHLAADAAGVRIELATIAAAYARIATDAEAIIVEGAGGALVPLDEGVDMLDIASQLRLPVLVVVGMRLGCLNHALLTAQAIAARGLTLVGWVANRIDPAMRSGDDNVADLALRLPAPCVADVGYGESPRFAPGALRALGLVSTAVSAGEAC